MGTKKTRPRGPRKSTLKRPPIPGPHYGVDGRLIGPDAPVKIGDRLPPGDVILDLVRLAVTQHVDASATAQMEHRATTLPDRVIHDFRMALGGEQLAAPTVGSATIPRSWWAMFKRDVLGLALAVHELETISLTALVDYQVVYPHLKLPAILPEVHGLVVSARYTGPQLEYQVKGVS